MTLGTAASKSMKNSKVSEILGGASSARKIAAPIPRGTAMMSAIAAVITVPYMNGKAPNLSSMGSQVEVRKKAKPNLCLGIEESCQSSRTSRIEISTTVAAKTKVISRATSSPSRRRDRKEREFEAGPALGRDVEAVATLLDTGYSLLFLGNDFLREPRVRKGFSKILPVVKHPGHEALDCIALGVVRELGWNEQPGESRNGVGGFSFGVRYRDAEIVRHVLGSCGCGCGDGNKGGLHENAICILHAAIRNFIGFR